MPYRSLAQERYFNANRAKLESEGVNVSEWNQASKGKKLPKKVHKYDGRRRGMKRLGLKKRDLT